MADFPDRPRQRDAAKHVVVLSSLDTKGAETAYLKEAIEARDCLPVLVDTAFGGEATIAADITAEEVARAGGSDLRELRASKDTAAGSRAMIRGASAKLLELLAQGRLDGVVAIGGASGTTVGTSIMKALPFGVPKFMLSSAASMPYAASYIGSKDITLMHSVVDLAGLNELTRMVLQAAAGGVCGMAEASSGPLSTGRRERPLVAVSEFKFAEGCARLVSRELEARGYDVIAWHANGMGDRAMEELVSQGLFDGVVDLVPAGVLEEMLGGNRAAGPTRLQAAAQAGVAQVVAPSGFDMLSCGPLERREKNDPLWTSRRLTERQMFIPDEFRVQARTTAEELEEVARVVAAKLAGAQAPVAFLVPLAGWSNLSVAGGSLHDPTADAAFLRELKACLAPPVDLREVEAELNSATFAGVVVDSLTKMMARDGWATPESTG